MKINHWICSNKLVQIWSTFRSNKASLVARNIGVLVMLKHKLNKIVAGALLLSGAAWASSACAADLDVAPAAISVAKSAPGAVAARSHPVCRDVNHEALIIPRPAPHVVQHRAPAPASIIVTAPRNYDLRSPGYSRVSLVLGVAF